jgi:putative Mg2+ transporter-C (MgtC) family protein
MEDWLYRLSLSLVLGSVIGFERFFVRKPAGLRTITLVCVGSAAMMLLGDRMHERNALIDPTRIAQGAITGIGFLGAGTILHRRNDVVGLTTAATIWIASAVGMAAGAGEMGLAVAGTVVGLVVLQVYGRLEVWMRRRGVRSRGPRADEEPGAGAPRPPRGPGHGGAA